MYQIEVKRLLLQHKFSPQQGWDVTIDIDAMERGNGGTHPPGKKEVAMTCETWMKDQGARIVAHPIHGRADFVAAKQGFPTYVVEVEGDSSRQREQAMYSALGQLLLSMGSADKSIRFALAVPDSTEWRRQTEKIPRRVMKLLDLEVWLVSSHEILTSV